MNSVPMTAAGLAKIKEELSNRKSVERQSIVRAIAEARKHGDLSENAEYHAAKEAQGMNEARIKDLEHKVSRAQIIEIAELSGDTVMFGATVTVLDEETEAESTYQIVGEVEADAHAGKISHTSPIARALIGKEVGDSVEVHIPSGEKYLEILKVEFI
ncbi:MAG TPA: transcription elongation factor GreA [Rhizobiales bacterium]|nr:transcription elongation factor GreA [Hyphomicrobiales bacterium]